MGKSEETRAKISETALASFKQRGYEQTTLRLIASEVGVSVGNAYYYFPTKNHLVQELYVRVQDEHLERATSDLHGATDLATRLERALLAGIDTLGPFHDSATGFLAAAIGPQSPVSPFGEDAAAPREAAIDVFRLVVSGASTSIPADLRGRLPELLWLAYMGLALFWVYDRSVGQAKTRRLAHRASKLFGSALPLARLPFVRGPLNELLDIIQEARS
ncbi:TetR/AcrR family transcriptional regulator [Glaciihabitans arcticus]|uniref:TetR/AcrR family transcriptional regulator n=1 Tax=Glaciihabitans arcticus TaxID=2668039 RepID=A0A4Q9GQE8_9MICO|nr:TetR family transcriptional regulator [Glaciihabitans arcticus]TBN56815.1 TetR/AcrR family transcriptional regulator [Glaciihabitans arcticus]